MREATPGSPSAGHEGLGSSWYREQQYQGALVSWMPLVPDGRRRMGVLVGAKRVRSGDPRSVRTVLEVMELGTGCIRSVEIWQAFPVQ